jgi:hypothetical protein
MTHSDNVTHKPADIDWTQVIKKEARGVNDADFGEVQEVVVHFILTEKGLVNKEKYYLPIGLVKGFDGDKLRFNISEDEATEKFKRETAPSAEEYAIFERREISANTKVVVENTDRVEAERKAQSIVQQAEDKAKQEAERKYEEITKEVEDKAQIESSDVKISNQKVKETNSIAHPVENNRLILEPDNYIEKGVFFNPFTISISLWNNYSKMWTDLYKEALNTSMQVQKILKIE